MARIVLIEDNAANQQLMRYLLSFFGHDVETHEDGRVGLEAVRRAPPDLVLCDIQLPGASGYDVARALRATDSRAGKVPLVAVTALAMAGDRERAQGAGFDGYIEKPIDPRRFVSQVEAYLTDRAGALAPAA